MTHLPRVQQPLKVQSPPPAHTQRKLVLIGAALWLSRLQAAGEQGRGAGGRGTVLAVPTGLVKLRPLCQHLWRRLLRVRVTSPTTLISASPAGIPVMRWLPSGQGGVLELSGKPQ